MPSKTTTVELSGCRFSYDVDGAGPPVLFIQGTGVHGPAWRPQIDVLCSEYECLSYDNRGMGRSQPEGASITVKQMAEDALSIMDHHGWKSAHVVGHSLGGIISQEVALRAPDRVRSLALLCTFSRGRDAMNMSLDMIWTSLRSFIGTKPQRRRAFLEMVMAPSELTGDVDKLAADFAPVFGHDLATLPPIARKQILALGGYDSTPRLAELAHIPTLVVGAELDRISPAALGRKIANGIPGARYAELAGAGHAAPLGRAADVNALLREHLKRASVT